MKRVLEGSREPYIPGFIPLRGSREPYIPGLYPKRLSGASLSPLYASLLPLVGTLPPYVPGVYGGDGVCTGCIRGVYGGYTHREAYTGCILIFHTQGGIYRVYTSLHTQGGIYRVYTSPTVPGRHARVYTSLSHRTREACWVCITLSPTVPGKHAVCIYSSHRTWEACWVCNTLLPPYPGGMLGVYYSSYRTREACWGLYTLPPYPGGMLVQRGASYPSSLYPFHCWRTVLTSDNIPVSLLASSLASCPLPIPVSLLVSSLASHSRFTVGHSPVPPSTPVSLLGNTRSLAA